MWSALIVTTSFLTICLCITHSKSLIKTSTKNFVDKRLTESDTEYMHPMMYDFQGEGLSIRIFSAVIQISQKRSQRFSARLAMDKLGTVSVAVCIRGKKVIAFLQVNINLCM